MLEKQDKETAFQKLDRLVGMGNVKAVVEMLKRQAERGKLTAAEYNLYYTLTGNPGTGKTTVAKLLGEIYYELGYLERGHTVTVTRNDLVAGYVGQTAIKTKEKINEALGGVLFIDEANLLINGADDIFGKEAMDTLIEAMTDKMGQFALIAAGYPQGMEDLMKVNPGLRRRFRYEIKIDDYSPEELTQIFNMNVQRKGYVLDDELTLLINPFFENWYKARDKSWANARNVEYLISKMYGSWRLRNGETTQDNKPIFSECDIPEGLLHQKRTGIKQINETCAVCKKGKGPEICEVCGFTDGGVINREPSAPVDRPEVLIDDAAGIEMVFVQGGTFKMGATTEQDDDYEYSEKPVHSVTLSDFYIGKYVVTQKQWVQVMGRNPSKFDGENLPVENVDWDNVQEFIQILNEKTGKKYRLPTEAEWEYAARGGNKSKGYKYSGSDIVDNVAWYGKNGEDYNGKTHPVGLNLPNELGIYDMSGNVLELVSDWYDSNYYKYSPKDNPTGPTDPTRDNYRVNRGGCWFYGADYCRVSHRYGTYPHYSGSDKGFRLALSSQ